MAQTQQGDSGSPLPSIILVLVMSAGAFWVQKVPLPSARPAEPMVVAERYAAQQDIDSRLWQDPFEAVKKAAPKSDSVIDADIKQALLKLSGASQSIVNPGAKVQNDLCNDLSPKDQVQVMAVMVNGAPYAEAAEARRRTRYAVVSGLGRSEYVPRDREHIGRITANIGDQSKQLSSVVIPFEWFQHANKMEKRVLVLWINETQIRDKPLQHLKELVGQACSGSQENKTVIIGPGSSDTLGTLLRDVKRVFQPDTSSAEASELQLFLKGLQIYSPKATAPDEHLLLNADWPEKGTKRLPSYCLDPHRTLASELTQIIPELQFHRTIPTDCALVVALTEELRIRGVEPDDGIVLISEWDTAYGRALPKAFDEVLKEKRAQKIDAAHETLWHYSYLRGLDGILPGESADKKTDESKKSREKDDPAIESAFGNHQKDYLRRIAARVADLDDELKDQGKKEGVKAIGILGSDVYDKLLILRALRPRFPEVIFFTTDMDARLLHNEEWESARNLVVASGYGLRLNGWVQQEIPPFRDGYQTAYFLSVLVALMDPETQKKAVATVNNWSWRPRIFEIGRSQAVDLSVTMKDAECTLEKCDSFYPYIKRPDPPPFIMIAVLTALLLLGWGYLYRKPLADFLHGAREDIRAVYDKSRHWYSPVHYLGFCHIRADFRYRKILRLLASRWGLGLVFSALLLLWLGEQAYFIYQDIFITGTASGGEPFSWYEGVSIWPSILLRIFTALLALYFLLLGMQRLRQNDERLTYLFFPEYKNSVLVRRRPTLGVRILHAFNRKRSLFRGRLWRWLKDQQLERRRAVLIWRNVVRSHGALFGRMVMGVFVLGAAVLVLQNLLPSEPPNMPSRGDARQHVYSHTVVFLLLSFISLLVFVIDSTRRTCYLATRLGDRNRTKWPKGTERWFGHKDHQLPLEGEPPGSRYYDDWLDIQLIAARTVVVGSFIYYPFIILSLIILARSSFFDNFQIPVGLGTLFILYLIIALACAMALRNAAERTRKHALGNLSEDILKALGNDARKQEVAQMQFMKESILAEHRGAFASFLQQPWLKALLLPLGSYSGVQLFESLSLLSV